MIDFRPACPWGRENRCAFGADRSLRSLTQGRRAKAMLDGMGKPEDAGPAKVCSVVRGCVGRESVIAW